MLQNNNFNKIKYKNKNCNFSFKFAHKNLSYCNLQKLAINIFFALDYAHKNNFSLNGNFNLNDIFFEVSLNIFNFKGKEIYFHSD